MMWIWVLACTGTKDEGTVDLPPTPTGLDPTTDTGDPPIPTGDTGTSGTADVVAASCQPSTNPLRVDCSVTLAASGQTTVVLSAAGVPTRTLISTAAATQHEILGWGLVADTTYTWTAGDQSGTVATGSLPADLAGASITTTGVSFGFDAVLRPLDCGANAYFAMFDGEGRIVWYEVDDVFSAGSMTGYDWSSSSSSILSANEGTFLEQGVGGEEILRLERGVDFDNDHVLHHDASAWGSYRYLLFERTVGGVEVDGIEVFEGTVPVGTWFMEDDFVVQGGNGDWGHANGLNVTDQGEIILSVLNFDAVVAIDGDPASPTFLQTSWHAAGDAASGLPGPDYLPVAGSDEGFDGQHNASRHGDDLWVFDNLSAGPSRAIRMAMDHKAGTLTVTGAWSFDQTCRNQGGALPIPGGALASCANVGEIWAFEEGQVDPTWTFEATCGGGGQGLVMTRGIPIFWPVAAQ